MQSIAKVFQQQPLVVVKLGSGGDDYGFIPEWLRPHTILLCLDGATSPNTSQATSSQFRRMIMVKDVIAGDQSKRTFIERTWWGCSSLLEAYLPSVERFGLESYFVELGRKPVTTTTLASNLSANGLDRVDVLMTDLEGLDFEIIRGCGDLIDSTTIVQSELRISQSYEGEPLLHEAVGYLNQRGFQLIGIKPEFWKPVSQKRSQYRDGVAAWADCLFFRDCGHGPSMGTPDENRLVRSIVLLALFNKPSLAAHLREKYLSVLSHELRSQLATFLEPALVSEPKVEHTVPKAPSRFRRFTKAVKKALRGSFAAKRPSAGAPSSNMAPVGFTFDHVANPRDNI